jgi:hypothetical protein
MGQHAAFNLSSYKYSNQNAARKIFQRNNLIKLLYNHQIKIFWVHNSKNYLSDFPLLGNIIKNLHHNKERESAFVES